MSLEKRNSLSGLSKLPLFGHYYVVQFSDNTAQGWATSQELTKKEFKTALETVFEHESDFESLELLQGSKVFRCAYGEQN